VHGVPKLLCAIRVATLMAQGSFGKLFPWHVAVSARRLTATRPIHDTVQLKLTSFKFMEISFENPFDFWPQKTVLLPA